MLNQNYHDPHQIGLGYVGTCMFDVAYSLTSTTMNEHKYQNIRWRKAHSRNYFAVTNTINTTTKMKLYQLCLLFAFFVAKSVANVVVTSTPLYLSKNTNVVVLKCIPINPGLVTLTSVTFSANDQLLYDSNKNFSGL